MVKHTNNNNIIDETKHENNSNSVDETKLLLFIFCDILNEIQKYFSIRGSFLIEYNIFLLITNIYIYIYIYIHYFDISKKNFSFLNRNYMISIEKSLFLFGSLLPVLHGRINFAFPQI